MYDSGASRFWAGLIVGFFGLLVIFGIIFGIGYASGVQVETGHVGVVSQWGQIQQRPLQPGIYHYGPFSGVSVVDVSTQPQNYHFPQIDAASRELQNVYVDVSVNYDVPQDKAVTLVANGGVDHILQQRMLPDLQDVVKEATPKYTMAPGPENILSHRPELRASIKQLLGVDVSAYGIQVTDIQITNIMPDPAYSRAIEAAALAQQDLVRSQNEAAAKVAAAQGDAQAAALRNQTLTQEQLQYQALQNQAAAIAKWDGKLPQYSGTSLPFIDINGGTPTK